MFFYYFSSDPKKCAKSLTDTDLARYAATVSLLLKQKLQVTIKNAPQVQIKAEQQSLVSDEEWCLSYLIALFNEYRYRFEKAHPFEEIFLEPLKKTKAKHKFKRYFIRKVKDALVDYASAPFFILKTNKFNFFPNQVNNILGNKYSLTETSKASYAVQKHSYEPGFVYSKRNVPHWLYTYNAKYNTLNIEV